MTTETACSPSYEEIETALKAIGLCLCISTTRKEGKFLFLIQTKPQPLPGRANTVPNQNFSHISITGMSSVSPDEALERLIENLASKEVWVKDKTSSKNEFGESYNFDKKQKVFTKKNLQLA